jgi:hypothetical protein
MLTFPGQNERAGELHRDLANEFDYANRLLDFWMRAPKDVWLAQAPLPEVTLGVAMTLNCQACRLFQSLVERCDRADAFSADILARSLYETALATCFVLVEEFGYQAGAVPKGAPISDGECLPRELRAKLYLAYQPLWTERHAQRLLQIPRFEELGKSIAAKYSDEVLSVIKNELGPQWTRVLQQGPSYSGLTIKGLAAALGGELDRWYGSFYFFQSRNTHGADAIQHYSSEHGPEYFSDRIEVSNALFAGVSMFTMGIVAAQENIRFGDEVDRALADFYQEYQRLW